MRHCFLALWVWLSAPSHKKTGEEKQNLPSLHTKNMLPKESRRAGWGGRGCSCCYQGCLCEDGLCAHSCPLLPAACNYRAARELGRRIGSDCNICDRPRQNSAGITEKLEKEREENKKKKPNRRLSQECKNGFFERRSSGLTAGRYSQPRPLDRVQ